ncbi:MAG: tetratricopeptide repeat protein [Symploca sp. SIO2C1]|nr:tetratricopeptide repeat protein [Symploca sp. SIO2C1]
MPRAVILTALPVEYKAVRNHLIDLQEKEHPQGTIYEQGKFVAKGQEWQVGIAEVGAGNAGAAAEAERAIAYFQPNILLFVGIAGGIKDVAIGDVVVATEVYGYESGKVGEQFFTRPKAGKSAYRLVQRAKFEARKGEWLQRLDSAPVSQPRVFVAPIVAGEKVVTSRKSAIFQFLRESYNDAIALEMEGFGFLSAAFAHPNIPAVVIRGISDLIEGKNDDSVESEDIRQAKASQHASAFAFEMLAKLDIAFLIRMRYKVPRFWEWGMGNRQSVGWLPTMASSAITAVGGFKLIQGELEPLTVILLAVGFVSLLSICLYVWFKRSRINGSGDTLVKHYSKKTRRLALLGLFAVALLMVLSGGGWYHHNNFQKHQVVVLVANFRDPQQDTWGVTEDIISQLEDALVTRQHKDASVKYDDVKVQALNETITAQEGIEVARAKGAKHHADIVLWGWYKDTNTHVKVTVKFEVLEKLHYLPSVRTKQLIQPIAQLNSFKIQAQLPRKTSYLTLFTIGLVRYEAEDYEAAITRFTKALEILPDAEQAIAQDTAIDALYFYKGNAHYYEGELDKAIANYNLALQFNRELVEAYNNSGIAYSDKGELDLAIGKKGELDLAIADFTQALEIEPEFAEAYNNRGIVYSDKGELDLAISDYNQALKINREDAEAYNNRGSAYSDKGELDLAISDFNRALNINPEYAGAYINRAHAYTKLGDKQKAIQDLKKVAKLYGQQGKTAKQQQVLELLKQLQQASR